MHHPPFNQVRGRDCWYSPMPLYHGTGMFTTLVSLLAGMTCAIAPKFSVSNFWPDVHDSGATMFIYVGETARYLLAAPPHPLERNHKLRLAYGNGLRPDIWSKLQTRFNIPEVAEFFNSSEGMFTLLVYSRNAYTAGCVGHHGLLFRTLLHNTYIPVRIDHSTGDIYRHPVTGFAERTAYAEGGEILVAVKSKSDFGGYWKNEEATNKRFATDVFKKGDLYYRSGDALRRGSEGHWYFLDRLGDTFRWKAENVSTAEVGETLGRFPGIAEANVYGVEVPGHEGRAGCAALQLSSAGGVDEKFLADLLGYCQARLPRYAVPVFLRVQRRSLHIHNHKQNKVPLRNEGVDPAKLGTLEKGGAEDKVFWFRPGGKTYVPFLEEDWGALERGGARL
ncbi:acetyl-CoA synthetase-like protein [Teratosphaeria nubilosa]|uniref:Acetyl-CoA synthetase-like protein n=1 Tax=Teratosphaeria nubilosa TaxID=161662 RepID=A0A6G1LC26_9PEZI|nr:acetyl-CoA synthetase-like protein [Teratosphaeria nubilosa]